MPQMRRGAWAAVGGCLLAAVLAGLASCRRGDSRPVVVLYCSVDQEFARGIVASFEKLTGIRVLVRYDEEASKTTGLVQRLRAEAKSPTADVFWSSEVFLTIRLAADGLLAPYLDAGVADWPAQFADPNGRWYAFALRGRVMAFDTRRVKPQDAPRRLEDLLDAKWKGRIVMARPQFGTTRGDVASWFAHYGADRAKEILAGLKANEVRLVQGNSTAVRAVAGGEADIALTDTDDVYVAQRNGWTIAMVPLDQGGEGALAIPNTAAIVQGAPHPGEARELMAFLLGEQVELALARSESHNMPIRPELAARPDLAPYAVGKPLKVDYAKVADQMPPAMEAVREIFR